jgi:ABC-type Zn uptake system ZnuABC Zn-binding protein ZnuA
MQLISFRKEKNMKKILTFYFAMTFLSILPLRANARLNVITTTQDLAVLTMEIGKGRVKVKSLTHGSQDVHFIEPKPSMILAAKRADMLILVGADLEIGWLPVLIKSARNRKISRGSKGYLDASTAVNLIGKPTGIIDRSMGDVHPQGNPHYFLDPMNGLSVARLISERLSEIDPPGAEIYQNNLESFKQKLLKQFDKWQNTMTDIKQTAIMQYHTSWDYLAKAFGFSITGQVEDKPGIPPSPSRLKSVIDIIQKQKVKLLLMTTYQNKKYARLLSEKTRISVLQLPISVGGTKDVSSYFDLFDYLVKSISDAK